MNFLKSAVLAIGLLLIAQGSVSAQTAGGTAGTAVSALLFNLNPIGVGLVIIGAGLGIGGLAKAAVESMSRQPEIAGQIQTAMVIAAALIEGVTLLALIILLIKA